MSPIARPDLSAVKAKLDSWLQNWKCATASGSRIEKIERASTGWSSDTLMAEVNPSIEFGDAGRHRALVFRVAPPAEIASFPVVDFDAQAVVMRALQVAGLPVPTVFAVENDPSWIGAPFLVMERVPGRSVGDFPAFDAWLSALPSPTVKQIHENFVDDLASVHRISNDEVGLTEVLRDSSHDLGVETSWWSNYVSWAADGDPTPNLVEYVGWCGATAPAMTDHSSICWGDARLGNVLLNDDGSTSALVDWELASIGPAEMDVAWYLALDRLSAKVTGNSVPGFLSRQDLIARYETRLGRRLENLEWHEIFALVRSVAINERQARIAKMLGVEYPGFVGQDNPLLGYIGRRIERFEASS